ncbi:MAG TPA: hypothetical protein VFG21_02345 [Xanthomonadaceae bacterium]|nr:hypothetical protein [Xanthomonadaceae bacterium]
MPITPAPVLTRPWVVPLLLAAIPVAATHLALWLSVSAGHVPACLPYLEGCTSISRAARHGLGNQLFRLLMLPAATLLWLNWELARDWLRLAHPDPRAGASLRVLGVVCAVALAVYATFLGSEGEVYRWLRRHGVTWYFAANFLAQLVFVYRLRQVRPRRIARAMLALCAAMLAMGLVNVAGTALLSDAGLKDRLENVLEWNLGLFSTIWFVLLAVLWRRDGYTLVARRQ